jgi:Holliday junction resolvasome RuvABC endonuclease subunit
VRRVELVVLRPVAVGWDPGLANLGGAVVLLGERAEGDQLLELPLLLTAKSDKKRGVMAADDDFRRARELAAGVAALFAKHGPGAQGSVKVMCAEAMSFVRSARTSAQIALAWGVLAAEVERRSLPVCQAGPQEVRRRFGLAKGAAKEEVHALLLQRYGAREVERALLRNATYRVATEKQKAELRKHPLDALASIAASDGSEVMRSVRASA